MCVWDFNNACDNYQEDVTPSDGFQLQDDLWYWTLFKDKDFSQKTVDRYKALRNDILSDEYIDAYIDGVREYLGEAVDRNYERWGYTLEKDKGLLLPPSRNLHSYDEAVDQLKTFVHRRAAFMDRNIESLRQYSAESKTKRYIENAN